MKTEKSILIAFLLNLAFSVFELVGGIFTGSVAILSDAIHDIGDAVSIGLSYFLEKISHKRPDENYTFGYARYSALSSAITTLILIIGSVIVMINAVKRLITPTEIHYDGMIVFALVGILVNCSAAFFTREGKSLSQKSVNLHMLEDALGWIVVFIGAIVMRFTDFARIDPILSIVMSAFILVNAVRLMKDTLEVFLEKTPQGIDVHEIQHQVAEIPGVLDVHHVHIWTLDGHTHCATMHIVTDAPHHPLKETIREKLHELTISHATLEFEEEGVPCHDQHCGIKPAHGACGHHHGHHHEHHHGHHHTH